MKNGKCTKQISTFEKAVSSQKFQVPSILLYYTLMYSYREINFKNVDFMQNLEEIKRSQEFLSF
jgi:hypothetical protein